MSQEQPDLPDGHSFSVPMMKEDRSGLEATEAATATASESLENAPVSLEARLEIALRSAAQWEAEARLALKNAEDWKKKAEASVRWSPSEAADTRQHTAGLRAFAGLNLEEVKGNEPWHSFCVLQGKAREFAILAGTCETDAMSRVLRFFIEGDLEDMRQFRLDHLRDEGITPQFAAVVKVELSVLDSVASRLVALAKQTEKS